MNPIGQTVNERYRIEGVVGSGGMATVYRAHDRLLSQTVALKMMVANQTEQPNHLRRFKAEARTMMRLHHPNVVTVLDFGDEPQPYIAMELVNGGSANDHLERPTPMPEAKALSIIDGVLAGLIHIHAAGTIHRDIKPANILITKTGTPKLTDFGIARIHKHDSFRTDVGAIMGTLEFMAPEQHRSATSVTEASDLYSVGATLYALLTQRSSYDLYVQEKQEDAFRDLRPDLRAFLTKACAFNPSNRFGNASEMQAALREVSETPETADPSQSTARTVPCLPPRHPAFVGRSDEMDQLEAWADSSANRSLSIVGLGGIGKSTLALEFCHRHTRQFLGGVWSIDLSTITSVTGLHQTLGAALGLNFDDRDPLNEVVRHLSAKQSCLLLFDNAEDVRPILSPFVGHLMEAVPNVRVIVTAREAFGELWETLLVVKELDVRASVALLMQATSHTFSSDGPTQDDTRNLRDIAVLLEGHPLSLELAAAQLDLMSPAQLYARFNRSAKTIAHSEGPDLLGLLDTRSNEATQQASVQAALAWSWSLLSPSEQSALVQCALFVDGFDVEAAEAVVELPPELGAPPLMVLLQSLRSRNLLRIRTPFLSGRRLSVPRLVRTFAVAHGNLDALESAELRMARHFAQMGEEVQIHRDRTGGVHRHRIAQLELANIQHSFEWAIEHQHNTLAALLSLAACALLRTTGPFDGLAAMLRRAKQHQTEETVHRARILCEQGRIASLSEGLDVAEQLLKEAIALADALSVQSVATRARVHIARIFGSTNRLSMALPMANAAVEIATQGSDQLDLPSALYCRGHLLRKSGKSEQALPDLQTALRGFQRMGDRGSEGMCFGELGEHHHYTGDTKRARRCYENAQAIALELDNKTHILRGHRRLAWLHMDAGDWEHAEAELRCGLRVAHEVGDLPGEASLIGTLGTVAALAGQFEAALTQFQEAEHMYEQHGNNAQGQRCRVNIANVLERLNRVDEAIEICEALKQEQGMDPQVRNNIAVMEMKLHIRRENWSEALALGDCALDDLENLQAWDTTVAIHAYRAICTAALGGDPEPHLARAKSLMAKIDLAEGSCEGEIVTAAANQVQDILRQRAIDPTDAC